MAMIDMKSTSYRKMTDSEKKIVEIESSAIRCGMSYGQYVAKLQYCKENGITMEDLKK
ncbi:MAG: hypothetical protein J6D27_00270 [Ruminiclostridium sp.]|nr:hypothetical protein [Ruminiclostridium sp.]